MFIINTPLEIILNDSVELKLLKKKATTFIFIHFSVFMEVSLIYNNCIF